MTMLDLPVTAAAAVQGVLGLCLLVRHRRLRREHERLREVLQGLQYGPQVRGGRYRLQTVWSSGVCSVPPGGVEMHRPAAGVRSN